MVDADLRLGRDGRLGVEGDAHAGKLDHVEIVGAVADGEHVLGVGMVTEGDVGKRLGLCGAAELGDLARQPTVYDYQTVGAVLVKAELSAIFEVNTSKPPETSAVHAPC